MEFSFPFFSLFLESWRVKKKSPRVSKSTSNADNETPLSGPYPLEPEGDGDRAGTRGSQGHQDQVSGSLETIGGTHTPKKNPAKSPEKTAGVYQCIDGVCVRDWGSLTGVRAHSTNTHTHTHTHSHTHSHSHIHSHTLWHSDARVQ